jgi:hypothetical protein
MPIVRHTLSITPSPDGSAGCILRMYDQDETSQGQLTYRIDAGPDLETRAQLQADLLIFNRNEELARIEYEQIIGNEE